MLKVQAAWALWAGVAVAQENRFIFTFGDSYTTTSFNAIGLTPATAPTANNPLGNPAYPGVTTTGGENWVDLLTARLSPHGTVAYNYAAGGAAVDNVIRYPQTSATIPDFREQIAEFTLDVGTVKPTYAQWTATNSVFIVFLGINDLVSELTFAPYSTLNHTFVVLDQTSLVADLTLLYGLGARRFVLTYVPPIYRTPLLMTPQFESTSRATVADWNTVLQQNANSFQASHPDIKVTTYDPTASYNQILDNPTANGAPDNTCYNANGVSCLWWDAFHPGQAIHKAMASDFHEKLTALGFYN